VHQVDLPSTKLVGVFENKLARRMYGRKRQEVAGS
jgi:hypothetical protein